MSHSEITCSVPLASIALLASAKAPVPETPQDGWSAALTHDAELAATSSEPLAAEAGAHTDRAARWPSLESDGSGPALIAARPARWLATISAMNP